MELRQETVFDDLQQRQKHLTAFWRFLCWDDLFLVHQHCCYQDAPTVLAMASQSSSTTRWIFMGDKHQGISSCQGEVDVSIRHRSPPDCQIPGVTWLLVHKLAVLEVISKEAQLSKFPILDSCLVVNQQPLG